MDQEAMTVETMLDIKVGNHAFRLTREEARRLRDMLTRALGEQREEAIMHAWPPTIQPLPAFPSLPRETWPGPLIPRADPGVYRDPGPLAHPWQDLR